MKWNSEMHTPPDWRSLKQRRKIQRKAAAYIGRMLRFCCSLTRGKELPSLTLGATRRRHSCRRLVALRRSALNSSMAPLSCAECRASVESSVRDVAAPAQNYPTPWRANGPRAGMGRLGQTTTAGRVADGQTPRLRSCRGRRPVRRPVQQGLPGCPKSRLRIPRSAA